MSNAKPIEAMTQISHWTDVRPRGESEGGFSVIFLVSRGTRRNVMDTTADHQRGRVCLQCGGHETGAIGVNISILASGAGGMYCGSCMRDNALAMALKRQGHQITLIPLFTPLRTEPQDASIGQVFY